MNARSAPQPDCEVPADRHRPWRQHLIAAGELQGYVTAKSLWMRAGTLAADMVPELPKGCSTIRAMELSMIGRGAAPCMG